MRRRALIILTALSALTCVATLALWAWTEALGRVETFVWGPAGRYRSLELRSDEARYAVLDDPGLAPTPFRWDRRRGGWLPPPWPAANPGPLPLGSVVWVLPRPNDEFAVESGIRAHGVGPLGFEYATFPDWYGPGTSVRSYRLSYFTVMLPSAVLPLIWLARARYRRWRHGRFGPGLCRHCGYDVRATPGRCPECGWSVRPA